MEQPRGRLCLLLSQKFKNHIALVTLRWRHSYRRSQDEIDAFQDNFNEQNTDIQLTNKENEKPPFLDSLVSCDNNQLRTTVYRKPTHTDRLLDESSRLHIKPWRGERN